MSDYVRSKGAPFTAHLLRRLSDELVVAGTLYSKELGIIAPPRTNSTLLLLDERGELSITDIASILRQSHPLVITWVKQLRELGLVSTFADPQDGRRRIVAITAAGKEELGRIGPVVTRMGEVCEQLGREAGVDLTGLLAALDDACRARSVLDRLRDGPDAREGRT